MLIDAIMEYEERSGTPNPTETVFASGPDLLAEQGVSNLWHGGAALSPVIAMQKVLAAMSEMLRQQQETQARQQHQFAQMMAAWSHRAGEEIRMEAEVPAPQGTEARTARSPTGGSVAAVGNATSGNATNSLHGSAVQWVALQIPEFAGGEKDNVSTWTQRVDRVAAVHGVADNVILLAASSRLTKAARRWYDIQIGQVLESWASLKQELHRVFGRKIPFYRVMQEVEARRWIPGKETFDEYAIEKMAIMHPLNLPEEDCIQLLIGGISQSTIRAAALSITAVTVEAFLERMCYITHGMNETEKRATTSGSSAKTPEETCRNCGKKGHRARDCRGEVNCFYCKQKGHRRFDCPTLAKKDGKSVSVPRAIRTPAAVSVSDASAEEQQVSNTIATVQGNLRSLKISSPLVTVTRLGNQICKLSALIDTGMFLLSQGEHTKNICSLQARIRSNR